MAVRIEVDGCPATEEGLRPLALVNYGHFTVMQARRHHARGIDLHLRRLVVELVMGAAGLPVRVADAASPLSGAGRPVR